MTVMRGKRFFFNSLCFVLLTTSQLAHGARIRDSATLGSNSLEPSEEEYSHYAELVKKAADRSWHASADAHPDLLLSGSEENESKVVPEVEGKEQSHAVDGDNPKEVAGPQEEAVTAAKEQQTQQPHEKLGRESSPSKPSTSTAQAVAPPASLQASGSHPTAGGAGGAASGGPPAGPQSAGGVQVSSTVGGGGKSFPADPTPPSAPSSSAMASMGIPPKDSGKAIPTSSQVVGSGASAPPSSSKITGDFGKPGSTPGTPSPTGASTGAAMSSPIGDFLPSSVPGLDDVIQRQRQANSVKQTAPPKVNGPATLPPQQRPDLVSKDRPKTNDNNQIRPSGTDKTAEQKLREANFVQSSKQMSVETDAVAGSLPRTDIASGPSNRNLALRGASIGTASNPAMPQNTIPPPPSPPITNPNIPAPPCNPSPVIATSSDDDCAVNNPPVIDHVGKCRPSTKGPHAPGVAVVAIADCFSWRSNGQYKWEVVPYGSGKAVRAGAEDLPDKLWSPDILEPHLVSKNNTSPTQVREKLDIQGRRKKSTELEYEPSVLFEVEVSEEAEYTVRLEGLSTKATSQGQSVWVSVENEEGDKVPSTDGLVYHEVPFMTNSNMTWETAGSWRLKAGRGRIILSLGDSGLLLTNIQIGSGDDMQELFPGGVEQTLDGHQKMSMAITVPSDFACWVKKFQGLSMALWVKVDQAQTGSNRVIFHRGHKVDDMTPSLVLRTSDMRLRALVSTTKSPIESLDSEKELKLNEWHHIAMTVDHEKITLWIDGARDSTSQLFGSPILNNGPMYIGKDPWGEGISGSVKGAFFYSRAISSAEVQHLFEGVCPNGCSGNGRCHKGICMCAEGWDGRDCSYVACPNDCSGNGQCISGNCTCNAKWNGPDCSVLRCPQDCSNHGTCKNGTCICEPGFAGVGCASEINSFVARVEVEVPLKDVDEKAFEKEFGDVFKVDDDVPLLSLHPIEANPNDHDNSFITLAFGNETLGGDRVLELHRIFVNFPKDARWRNLGISHFYPVETGDCGAQDTCVHGECLKDVGGSKSKCYCYGGFFGDTCSESYCPNACNLHGECDEKTKTCTCDRGWSSDDCSVPVDVCPNDCTGHGACNGGVCECEMGYFGDDCSLDVNPAKKRKNTWSECHLAKDILNSDEVDFLKKPDGSKTDQICSKYANFEGRNFVDKCKEYAKDLSSCVTFVEGSCTFFDSYAKKDVTVDECPPFMLARRCLFFDNIQCMTEMSKCGA